ncbi:MAG: ABC transporter permease, partial [Bdellovibrionales bacterium]|nr:ABC transporter permease [Bdellovibrionales bacterium]
MMRAIHKKLLRDIKGLRGQAFSTALLIASGVGLLVSSWSAYRSLVISRNEFYRDFRFGDVFADIKRAPLELLQKIRAIPGVQTAEGRVIYDGLLVNPRDQAHEPGIVRLVSLPSSGIPILNRIHLRSGRFPLLGSEIEVVLHEGFANKNKVKPGDFLTIIVDGHEKKVRIVGVGISPEFVIAATPGIPMPDDRHYAILWMLRNELERITSMRDSFNNLSIQLGKSEISSESLISELDQVLSHYGGRGAYLRANQISNMFVEDEIREQRTMALINPVIFLGIAAFLIHIIISRLIDLQRLQVATLKSIGYSNQTVLIHYLTLVLLLSLIGSVFGIGIGRSLGALLAKSYETFFRFPKIDFSLSLSASVIGLLAGTIPAWIGTWTSLLRAFRLPPAEAMRPATPRVFQSGWLERLSFWNRVPIHRRMTWRTLTSRPVRLGLIIFGISLATSIVVTSRGWVDMLHFIITTQFQRSQREDISVTLIRPVGLSGLQEISRLPGVLSVEGYRGVPARIRHNNLRREISLLGWPGNSRMRQALRIDLSPIVIPEHGVLLGRFYEHQWGIRQGDWITLELLEGSQKWIEVSVSGFTDDLMGHTASIRIESLWGLLSESPGYNLVELQVDPNRTSDVYLSLKNFPLIAGVHLREAVYRGFQSTIGGVVRVVSTLLLGFSLMISLGIIFNSVQASFSERSWELCSMRILGFPRNWVFGLLVSEVSIQVIGSLLPGCILGRGLMQLLMSSIHAERFV